MLVTINITMDMVRIYGLIALAISCIAFFQLFYDKYSPTSFQRKFWNTIRWIIFPITAIWLLGFFMRGFCASP